jgi:hypothetical protein
LLFQLTVKKITYTLSFLGVLLEIWCRRGGVFVGAVFAGAVFAGAVFAGAVFAGAVFAGAVFAGAAWRLNFAPGLALMAPFLSFTWAVGLALCRPLGATTVRLVSL